VTAYAAEQAGKRCVAIINKAEEPTHITLPEKCHPRAMRLTGPGLDAKEGTTFTETHITVSRDVVVPAHSAMIFEI